MAGYTKLFSEIIHSTIWQESDQTRIVWITMLALSNKYGDVSASVPGLAHTANVSLPECEKALEKLLSPDPYSRSIDYEGRRIKIIEGGWNILNYQKYRNKMRAEERKEYLRIKQAEYRSKKRKSDTGLKTPHPQKQPKNEAPGFAQEGQTPPDSTNNTLVNKSVDVNRINQCQPISRVHSAECIVHSAESIKHNNIYAPDFEVFWSTYPKKVGKGEAYKVWRKIKPSEELQATILTAVERQSKSDQWRKDGGQFVPNPATWLNQGRWDDELPHTETTGERIDRLEREGKL